MPTGHPINWTAVVDKLGRVPDEKLAAELGCSMTRVAEARRALGRLKARSGPAGIDWDSVTELGKLPDAVLAHRLGVTRPSVCAARNRRNIPPAPTRRAIVDMPVDVADRIREKYAAAGVLDLNFAALLELMELSA